MQNIFGTLRTKYPNPNDLFEEIQKSAAKNVSENSILQNVLLPAFTSMEKDLILSSDRHTLPVDPVIVNYLSHVILCEKDDSTRSGRKAIENMDNIMKTTEEIDGKEIISTANETLVEEDKFCINTEEIDWEMNMLD